MGILAWIVLGAVAGIVAEKLTGERIVLLVVRALDSGRRRGRSHGRRRGRTRFGF